MTKAAIKKRLQRDKEPADKTRARLDKMNQDKKERITKETQAEGDIRRAGNREGTRKLRASKKSKINEETSSTNDAEPETNISENEPMTFHVGLAHLSGGNPTESTLIRKRKPINFTMADLEAEKSDDSGDEFSLDVQPSTSRTVLKRSCTKSNYDLTDSDSFNENHDDLESSIDSYVDHLVEAHVSKLNDEIESPTFVSPILDIASNVKPRKKKGNPNIGRKTKKDKNFQKH